MKFHSSALKYFTTYLQCSNLATKQFHNVSAVFFCNISWNIQCIQQYWPDLTSLYYHLFQSIQHTIQNAPFQTVTNIQKFIDVFAAASFWGRKHVRFDSFVINVFRWTSPTAINASKRQNELHSVWLSFTEQVSRLRRWTKREIVLIIPQLCRNVPIFVLAVLGLPRCNIHAACAARQSYWNPTIITAASVWRSLK